MKKFFTAGMAALTLAGSSLAAAPASAHDYGGHGWGHGDGAGFAIAGGILGLALGAALANHQDNYPQYGYAQPYGGGYGADYGPGYYPQGRSVCVSRRSVWDPYEGRYIVRQFRHAC